MNIRSITLHLVLAFFFLMLTIPTMHQGIRGALLAVLLFIFGIRVLISRHWHLDKSIFIVFSMCFFSSCVFFISGVLQEAPGVYAVSRAYLIWPCLYIFIIGCFNNIHQIQPLQEMILKGTIAAIVIGILFGLESRGVINIGVASFFSDHATFGFDFRTMGMSLPSTATVIYGVPYLLAWLLISPRSARLSTEKKIYIWLALLLGVALMAISSRRVFWVSLALAPIVTYFLCWASNIATIGSIRTSKVVMLASAFVIGSSALTNISVLDTIADFMYGFEFNNDDNISAIARTLQWHQLLHGWKQAPIFGLGFGATTGGVIRDAEAPWSFELSYVALLFQTGVLGVTVYSLAITWLLWRGVKIIKGNPHAVGLIPLLSALCCFLVANATNPYLIKFDFLWTLFLPVAFVNAWSLDEKNINLRQEICIQQSR